MAYITRGKSSVCYTSRVSFFEESFRVPKVVPKDYTNFGNTE